MFDNNRTNCPNCGGALTWGQTHCEFCGTRIVDLTMLDFDAQEPAAFVFKMPHNDPYLKKYKDKDIYISMMAKPHLGVIETTVDSAQACGGWGNPKLVQWDYSKNVNVEVTLTAYASSNQKGLITVRIEDRKND